MSAAQFPLDMALPRPAVDTVVRSTPAGVIPDHGRSVSMGAARSGTGAYPFLRRGVPVASSSRLTATTVTRAWRGGLLPSVATSSTISAADWLVCTKEGGRAGSLEALTQAQLRSHLPGFTVWAILDGPMGSPSRRRLPTVLYTGFDPFGGAAREAIIYRNGEPIEKLDLAGRTECDIDWRDDKPGAEGAQSYFTRVLRIDCETAWSSPVWIDHE